MRMKGMLLLFALVGCAADNEKTMIGQLDRPTLEMEANFDAECRQRGTLRMTPAYERCMKQLWTLQQADRHYCRRVLSPPFLRQP